MALNYHNKRVKTTIYIYYSLCVIINDLNLQI